MPVVGMQPGRQCGDALMGFGVGASVGPLPQSALYEALSLTVSAGCRAW
jgi:hypothetical protein